MTSPPSTRLSQSAASVAVQLKGAHRVQLNYVQLVSDDGEWHLTIPASAFPGLVPNPDESVIVTLGLILTRVEEDTSQ